MTKVFQEKKAQDAGTAGEYMHGVELLHDLLKTFTKLLFISRFAKGHI